MNTKRQTIQTLQERLAALPPLNSGEIRRMQEEFEVANCYHSNAIAGSTLTLQETALILKEGVTIAKKPIKEYLDAIGHRDAFAYLWKQNERHAPLCEEMIQQIHSLVLMVDRENRGVYRRVPVMILGSEHSPAQPDQIDAEMQKALERVHTVSDPILAAAQLHLQLESIHPFIDGNGRTGRLVLNYELMRNGLYPVTIRYEDRFAYYDCFAAFHKSGEIEPLARLVADYEIRELEHALFVAQGIARRSGDSN